MIEAKTPVVDVAHQDPGLFAGHHQHGIPATVIGVARIFCSDRLGYERSRRRCAGRGPSCLPSVPEHRGRARQSGRCRAPVAWFAAALLAGLSCRPSSPSVRLAQEFDGAYPAEASPNGRTQVFELVADEAELALVNGVGLRVWAYNGQVPGPTLHVRLGDRVQVKFTNRLEQPTTIHWHGVRVPNGMDGVPHATQPPVEPGGTFIYDFTPKDAGTFWFHPHLRTSEQVERGLYGVLIVDDPEPAPYAQDVVWVLHDWLLDKDRQIVGRFNTPHDLAHDGRWGNTITVNGRTDTTLRVQAGERIRLRIINSSNGRAYVPDLLGLGAKLIAVDGLYLREAIDPGRFELAPGNRIDLDLSFESGESRRLPIIDRFYARSPQHLADIIVDGIAPSAAPGFASPARARVPAWREGLAVPATMEFRLNARRGGQYGIEWTINGEAFTNHEPASPALTLSKGAWARLRFTNESARLHPIHLHGMFFKVLGRNGTPMDEPFFRDTVLIHAKEQVDIGVVPLDEGRWMMHCHILEHAEAGMMTMIDVRN